MPRSSTRSRAGPRTASLRPLVLAGAALLLVAGYAVVLASLEDALSSLIVLAGCALPFVVAATKLFGGPGGNGGA